MRVCVAGTFSILHRGHKQLLDTAFETAGDDGVVYIGITDGDLLNNKKYIKPYQHRVDNICHYLKEKGYEQRARIRKILDKYDFAVLLELDAIVVSPETFDTAQEINTIRVQDGKKPLQIVQIPYIFAEDGKPISSTRIFKKEIDENGKCLH